MKEAAFSTDYLVIGAGLTGLCFADEILRRSRAHITIVDKRHAPGGHWNEVYPFVKLHQPSAFYGVESTTLGNTRIDNSGPNKGFSSLATGPEITAYCHAVMNDRLLPGGRVTYLPMTEHLGGGAVRGLLSGKVTNITIRKKLVDASYYTNSIPLTHRREFQTAPTVTCVPPNDLPRLASEFEHFTILGGGKTGIDTCIWLIESGVSPERIRWIIPRDQWFVNRAKVQPADSRFFDVFGGFADSRDDIAAAASPDDLAKRHEQSGVWLRLSQEVWPVMFHAAHISQAEIDALNQIEDVVRLGRVSHISGNRLTLANGEILAPPNTLYVDCTASAIRPVPAIPVFEKDQIVIQAIRFPQIPFSSALIAFLEALIDTDEEKNQLTTPVPVITTVADYIRALKPDLDNRLRQARIPEIREWTKASRLDGFAGIAASVQPHELEKIAILERVRASTSAAYGNLVNLLKSVET